MDLSNTKRQRKLMTTLPVDEVWGVGRCISKELDAMGVKTVCGLADTDIRLIHEHFNVVFERTVRESRGEPCLALEEFVPVKQEIICSKPFGEKLTGYNVVREAICIHAAHATEKLRRERQLCRFTSAPIKASPFSLNESYYSNSASIKLLTSTQDSREIMRVATRSLDAVWWEGLRYQRVGVILDGFFSPGVAQLNLLNDNALQRNSDKLMAVLDMLSAEKGKGTLYFTRQGV